MKSTDVAGPRFAEDLLLLYFEHMSTTELVTSSHVCRNWRGVIYSRSKFTSEVVLESTTDSALARFTAQMDAPRTGRLFVALHIVADDGVFVARALCTLSRQLSRVRVLSLYINEAQALALWQALRVEAPQLTELYLSFAGRSTSTSLAPPDLPADIFGGFAPILRRIELTGVRLPEQTPAGLKNTSFVSLFEEDRLDISLRRLVAFPKLDMLVLMKLVRGQIVLEEPEYVDSRTLSSTAPRLGCIYLHLHDDAKIIINKPWVLSLFKTIAVSNSTNATASACLDNLPSGALHLFLRPSFKETTFFIDIRNAETDSGMCFEEPRCAYEASCDRLRGLLVRGRWLERVTDVTIALSIWSHPHLAQWVPRLPSAKRVGVMLDKPVSSHTTLKPAVKLDCPSLTRLDIATVQWVEHIHMRDIESFLDTGFVEAPQRLALGVCEGLSVSGSVDGTKFNSQRPLPRLPGLLKTW